MESITKSRSHRLPKLIARSHWDMTAAKVPQPLASLWRRLGFALWHWLHGGPQTSCIVGSKQLRPMGEATRYGPPKKIQSVKSKMHCKRLRCHSSIIIESYQILNYHIHLLVRQHASLEAPLVSWDMHCPRNLLDAWSAEIRVMLWMYFTICDAISSFAISQILSRKESADLGSLSALPKLSGKIHLSWYATLIHRDENGENCSKIDWTQLRLHRVSTMKPN